MLNTDVFWIGLGSVVAFTALLVAGMGWWFRSMLTSSMRDQDVARATRDAQVSGDIVNLTNALSQETYNRISWQQDMDRSKQNTKIDHDRVMDIITASLESHKNSLDDTIRRVVKLETITENIDKTLNRLENKLETNADKIAKGHEDLMRSIQSIRKD